MFVDQAKSASQTRRARVRAGLLALPIAAITLLAFGAQPASAHPTVPAPTAPAADPPAPASIPSAVSGPIVVASPKPGGGPSVQADPVKVRQVVNCSDDGRRGLGRLEWFGVLPDGSIEHEYELSPGGDLSGWISLGGVVLYDDFGVEVNYDCKIEVFGTGTDRAVWTTWQTNPGGGPWAPWTSLGGKVNSSPDTIFLRSPEGIYTLGVCASHLEDNLGWTYWCNRHTERRGSPWTGWFEDETP